MDAGGALVGVDERGCRGIRRLGDVCECVVEIRDWLCVLAGNIVLW